MNIFLKKTRSERGVYALEYALVFPVFFVLLYAIIFYGVLYAVNVAVVSSAEEAGRAALHKDEKLKSIVPAVRSALSWLPDSDALSVVVDAGDECRLNVTYRYADAPLVPSMQMMGMGIKAPEEIGTSLVLLKSVCDEVDDV